MDWYLLFRGTVLDGSSTCGGRWLTPGAAATSGAATVLVGAAAGAHSITRAAAVTVPCCAAVARARAASVARASAYSATVACPVTRPVTCPVTQTATVAGPGAPITVFHEAARVGNLRQCRCRCGDNAGGTQVVSIPRCHCQTRADYYDWYSDSQSNGQSLSSCHSALLKVSVPVCVQTWFMLPAVCERCMKEIPGSRELPM